MKATLIIGLLVVAALVAAAPILIRQIALADAKQGELNGLKSTAYELHLTLEAKESFIKSKRNSLDFQNKMQGTSSKIAGAIRDATMRLGKLQSEREELLHQFVVLVKKEREAAVGSQIEKLTLESGATLENVVIQKVADSDINVSHSSGLARIAGTDVPKKLRDQFHFGIEARAAAATASANVPVTSIIASSPNGSSARTLPQTAQGHPTQETQPPATAQGSGTISNSARTVAHLQVDIDSRQQEIDEQFKNKERWADRAKYLREQASSAQAFGRPSYTYSSQASQADRMSVTIDAHIAKLRQEIDVLKKKQVDATTASPQ